MTYDPYTPRTPKKKDGKPKGKPEQLPPEVEEEAILDLYKAALGMV